MKKQRLLISLVCILCLGCLMGCANLGNSQSSEGNSVIAVSSSVQTSAENTDTQIVATSSDLANNETANTESVDTAASSTIINLSDYGDNSVVTINTAGDYTLTGTLMNGQIIINVGDEEKVQLYLNNAVITNTSGSAIFVQNAGKVIITLNDGTVNTVTDGATYSTVDENGDPDAAIFSHDDLTINGSGSLTVQANYANGIESRDDLKISGGNISVTAVNAGLFGNSSVEIKDAVVVVIAGVDAIHSDGDILIESGTLTISSGDDGMHADATLTVNDGTIDILQSYEGIEGTDVIINGGTLNVVSSDDGINGAGGDSTGSDTSTNGFPQDMFSGGQGSITINGGTITIAAAGSGAGDGLDANGSITITGGDTILKTPASYRDYSSVDYTSTISLSGGSVRTLDTNGNYSDVTASSISTNGRGRR